VDLLEFQGKQFFATFGIPVSDGRAVDTVQEAADVVTAGLADGTKAATTAQPDPSREAHP